MFDKINCRNNKISTCSSTLIHRILISVLVLLCFSGCAGKNNPQFPPESNEETMAIHVAIYHGHSGIILPYSSISDDLQRFIIRFKGYPFVEFGWGDEDFYRTPEANAYIAIKAALLPTASVLHVVGIKGSVEEYVAGVNIYRIYRIELSREGFIALCNFIRTTFSQDKRGDSLIQRGGQVSPGYGTFYKARPKFFFPRTCNSWVAKAMQKAGVPISPWANICAKKLARNVAQYGRLIAPVEGKYNKGLPAQIR